MAGAITVAARLVEVEVGNKCARKFSWWNQEDQVEEVLLMLGACGGTGGAINRTRRFR
jgi:hypothetical protein